MQSRGNYSTWAKRRQQQQLTHEREMQHKAEMIKQLRGFDIGAWQVASSESQAASN